MNVSSVTSFIKPAIDPATGSPAADQRLTVDSTVGGVQLTPPANDRWGKTTKIIVVDVQTNAAMVTFDGSAPTTTNGHMLGVGFTAEWDVATAKAAKFIATAAGNGVIHASEFSW